MHDENNETKVGDIVQAIETRPLSKEKRHTLYKIISRGEGNDSRTNHIERSR